MTLHLEPEEDPRELLADRRRRRRTTREERIYHFQKYVLENCRGARELPVTAHEGNGEPLSGDPDGAAAKLSAGSGSAPA